MKMNLIKKILLVFFTILTVLFILSVFLPSEYSIVRTSNVDCERDSVYKYLTDIDKLDDWFYITKRLDSTIVYKFNHDVQDGKYSVEWNGELMGQGMFQYTHFVENELIEFTLSFQNNSVTKSGRINLKSNNGGTEIKWTDYGENGWNPVNRIFGLFIDGFLGPDMEKSLEKIKINLGC